VYQRVRTDLACRTAAIAFMTRAGPTSVEWLTPDRAKEFRVAWAMLQPPRAIPIPAQPKLPPGAHLALPPQVPWSKSAPQQALQQPAPPPPASPKSVTEDPADPNGKRFFGWVIWRTETITPGPGQPPELAIRADIEVPGKLAMTWSLRRSAINSIIQLENPNCRTTRACTHKIAQRRPLSGKPDIEPTS
jgi:hypothetical protein